LIKFLVVGVCNYHKEFDKWRTVECVSSFSRFFDHDIQGALVME